MNDLCQNKQQNIFNQIKLLDLAIDLYDTQRTEKHFKLQYGDTDCKKLQDQKSGSLESKQGETRVIDSGGTCICVHHHPYVTFMRQMTTLTG